MSDAPTGPTGPADPVSVLAPSSLWTRFTQSFHDSEVIVWGRLQVVFAAVWFILIHTDLSTIITNPKYLTYWLMASGVITEVARRRRATFTASDDDANKLKV
jgi:hypothetical protein